MTLHLNVVWTIVAALFAIELGKRLNRLFVWFDRASVPPSVTAGLLLSLILAGLRAQGWLDVRFDTAPRDVLLLVFFSSLGLGAHLSRIATAGRGALVVCLGIVLVIVAQNVVGIAVAHAFGDSPLLGVFLGSAAFAGGHGTVVAWASTPLGTSTPGAFEIGIGSATLGLVFGGLVAGPVSVWLTTRDRSAARHSTVFADDEGHAPERESAFSTDRWLPCLLWMALSLAVAQSLLEAAAGLELKTPAFLAVLLISVVITNAADLAKRPIDTEVTDLVGTVALRVFLAIAMLSLNWGELVAHLPMLLTAAAVQVVVTVAVAVLVVYTLFGRGPEGAAATGGFIGMSLGAMPVGLAVMRRMNIRFGHTPRALLAVTLAASLFTDTANALGITGFIRWIGM
jgi:glutamate:Na+ symporter, ESS family